MLDLAKLVREIKENGPTRVVINSHGEATTPFIAKEKGITPTVVFIRNDGWSLGAPAHFEGVAEDMWSDEWIAVMREPFEAFEAYTSFR